MSRIAETFAGLKAKGERALVLFVTAGDPSLEDLPAILDALAEGGADLIEVGLPFSDPIADGPTIQASSQRALDRGVRTSGVFEAVARFDRVPVVLMGYMNPILRLGYSEFAKTATDHAISGTIVCDVTPDEAGDWVSAARATGLDTVFLSAPTSTDERLDRVARMSTGFVYAVSRTGVTGSKEQAWDEAKELVGRMRARTELPICVGFGISTPDHVREVCQFADGVIIGSKLVDWLAEHWQGGAGRGALVAWVRDLKAATR